jgi:phospholipid-translocating ATPase
MFTYIAPLVFVLIVSMGKEAYDDIKRMQRDRELNNSKYKVLRQNGTFVETSSKDLKVGNIIRVD